MGSIGRAVLRVNGNDVALVAFSAALLVGGVIVAADDPQVGLDVALLLAGVLLTGMSLRRLSAHTSTPGPFRAVTMRVLRGALSAGGFILTGLVFGVLASLGFIMLVLIPLFAAGAGVLWGLRSLKRYGRPGVAPVPRYGRHLDIVLATASVALLAVAAATTLSEGAVIVAAAVTIAGGSMSSAVMAFGLTRALGVRKPVVHRVAVAGEGLSVLCLHLIFAVAPTMVVIWTSIVTNP